MKKEKRVKPKVSVIIPVYKTERFLQDCIDSLINQTLKEIECIFIDDASPDNCLTILKQNQKKYPDRIKIIDSKVNLKQGGARNLGINAAQADYVAFVDSDDFVAPTMLESLYDRIVERKADVSLIRYATIPEDAVYSTYMLQDFKENLLEIWKWDKKAERFDGHRLSEKGIEKASVMDTGGVWGALWKKSLIVLNDIYFPKYLLYEDNYWAWMIRLYVRKYTFVDDVAYFYRKVESSTVHAKNQWYHFDRIEILHLLLREAKKRGLYSKYYNMLEYYSIFTCFSTYFLLMHKFDDPPKKLVKIVPRECLSHFPYWKDNIYYKKAYPKSRRIKYAIIAKMPIIMLYVHPILEKITKKFQT